MKNLWESEDSVSSVIGVVLLVGITVMMVSLIALTVFAFETPQPVPQARIVVLEAKGGLPPVKFNENWITLYHKGGNVLDISRTKIQIRGEGGAQNITHSPTGSAAKGNILVEYTNLRYEGKLEAKPNRNTDEYSPEYHGYEYHNPGLNDGLWSAGEKLVLNGQDSINRSESSTVKVYMDKVKTSNNWRFKEGGVITISVIDTSTDYVIASSQVTVKPG